MSDELKEESKTHIKKILLTLIRGGHVIDEDDDVYNLEEVGLGTTSGRVPLRVEIDKLTDYEIYIDPKDKEIRRLSLIIDKQNEVIQKMAQNENEKKGRKAHVRLSKSRKAELCQYAVDNVELSNTQIATHFEVSQSVVGIILDSAKIRMISRRT